MTPSKGGKIAVVEIGSDAVRLLVGQPRAHRKARAADDGQAPLARPGVRHVDSRIRPIYGDTGRPPAPDPEAAAVEVLASVTRYLRLADRAGATPVIVARPDVVASAEGGAVLSLLAAEVPDAVRRPSAGRARELAFAAVQAALDDESAELVVSISAAETDVILSTRRQMSYACSLAAGSATLAARLPDPPTPLEWALEAVRLGSLLSTLPAAVPLHAYVFGDGADVMAGFDTVRGEKRPLPLSLGDLDRLSDEVVRTSTRKVARRTGAEPWRIAQTAPAALLLASLLQRYGLQRCVALPQSLRDGVILAATAEPDAWWLDRPFVPAQHPARPHPGSAAEKSVEASPDASADASAEASRQRSDPAAFDGAPRAE